jgi:hypothetical protein
MKFIPFYYLTITINAAETKITRRSTMHKNTKCISETLLNKGRKSSQILCYIIQEKYLYHQEITSTQEGAQTLEL